MQKHIKDLYKEITWCETELNLMQSDASYQTKSEATDAEDMELYIKGLKEELDRSILHSETEEGKAEAEYELWSL